MYPGMGTLMSPKDQLILDLLSDEDLYGLDLIHNSGGLLKRGDVYVRLARLKERGLIKSKRVVDAVGSRRPPRTLYSLVKRES